MALSFDATFYQAQRPDVFNAFVATSGSTGLTWAQFAQNHYNTFGRFEGSDPSASFDTSFYLSQYPDVAAAGVNPFDHFLAFGAGEERLPTATFPKDSFVPATYAAANPDLAAAGITSDAALYQHWVIHGQFEGRSGAPETSTGTPGDTFTLTAGADTVAGTGNDDTINALTVNGSGAAATTLSAFDNIDGGAGTDTLNIFNDNTNNTSLPGSATIQNVEIININNDGGAFHTGTAGTVDASKFSGATQIWQAGVAATTLDKLGADTTAGFRNFTGTVTTSINAAGAAAAIAVDTIAEGSTFNVLGGATGTLNSVTLSGSVTDTNADGTVGDTNLNVTVGKDVESLSVNSAVATTLAVTDGAGTKTVGTVDASASSGAITYTGAANTVATIKGGSGKDSLTIITATAKDNAATAADETVSAVLEGGAGDDTLTVNTTGAGTTTVSAGDGNDTLVLTGRGTGKLSVDLGAGDDKLTGAGSISGTDSIDGGAGSDTLLLSAVGAANIGAFSNFEVFDAAALNKTLDVDILAANNTVSEFIASADTGGAAVLTNVGAGVGFRVTGDTTLANVTTLTQKAAGALTVTLDIDETGTTAATTVSTAHDAAVTASNATSIKAAFDSAFVGAATGATDNVANLAVTGTAATTLEVVSGGANASNDLDYTTATATGKSVLTGVTVSGDQALDLDLTIAGGGTNEVATVNAGSHTGGLTFALDDLKAEGTITLGSGDDVITAQTGAAGGAATVAAVRAVSGFEKGTAEDATAQKDFDVLALAGAVQAADIAATATHTVKDGLLTFNGAGPATLADAVDLAITAIGANEAVTFEYVGKTYIFAEGATDGNGDDVLVELTGVTGLTGLDDAGAGNLYVF